MRKYLMKPNLVPAADPAHLVANPADLVEPTRAFRRRSWTDFQLALDPLGAPKPLAARVPKSD
jgi:hypothetical protein